MSRTSQVASPVGVISCSPTARLPGAFDSQENDRPGTTSVTVHAVAGSFG